MRKITLFIPLLITILLLTFTAFRLHNSTSSDPILDLDPIIQFTVTANYNTIITDEEFMLNNQLHQLFESPEDSTLITTPYDYVESYEYDVTHSSFTKLLSEDMSPVFCEKSEDDVQLRYITNDITYDLICSPSGVTKSVKITTEEGDYLLINENNKKYSLYKMNNQY